jgi:hypothetical protein
MLNLLFFICIIINKYVAVVFIFLCSDVVLIKHPIMGLFFVLFIDAFSIVSVMYWLLVKLYIHMNTRIIVHILLVVNVYLLSFYRSSNTLVMWQKQKKY